MDKQAEIVKRLQETLAGVIRTYDFDPGSYYCKAITDAIAYINATPSRDEVLEKVERMASGLCELDQDWFIKKIRALKSAPFTRTDGTTSPERGTVEDRREGGNKTINRADKSKWPPRGHVDFRGRRSNDRARWTGEAALVVDTVETFAAEVGGRVCVHGHVITNDRRWTCSQCDDATPQPAQEAQQPEKPGLWDAFTEHLGKPSDHFDNVSTAIAFSWLLRELDARQGEK